MKKTNTQTRSHGKKGRIQELQNFQVYCESTKELEAHQVRSFSLLMSRRFFLSTFLCDSAEEIYLLFSLSSKAGPSSLLPGTRASSEGM